MGSVKDLDIIRDPTERREGLGKFVFSDRYSVFDWGEMPDRILNKGAALCMIAAYLFEQAKRLDIATHYQGIADQKRGLIDTSRIFQPTNTMLVKLVRVVRPEFKEGKYDYAAFQEDLDHFLIPLEIIYRNQLLPGSRVFSRLDSGVVTLRQLGLDHRPESGEKLDPPILDVSTKLESEDRYLNWEEAQQISGLSDLELKEVKKTLREVNDLITYTAEKAGLVNLDGKIELAYDPQGRLMVVDVFGTPDECRFTFDGVHVSKEVAREFYKKTAWCEAVSRAKEEVKKQGSTDWKTLCTETPPPLPLELRETISQMYTSIANAFLERRLFDSPPLEEVVRKYQKWEKGKV